MTERNRQRIDDDYYDQGKRPRDHRRNQASSSRRQEPVFRENDRTAHAQQQPQYYSREAYSATGKRRSYPYEPRQNRTSYKRRQSTHQKRTYSRLDQSENEQASDGIFSSRSARERTSSRRYPISRKRVRSEGDGSNKVVSQPPKPGPTSSVRSSSKVNANTQPESPFPWPSRVESEGNTNNQPAPQPAEPGTTSSTKSKSVVPTSGENQAEQLSQNSEHRSQSVHDYASNQQASSSPRPGLNSSMQPPSLVQNNTAKKQSKQSLQNSENVSKTRMEKNQKFIRVVSKHPLLYDPKDSAHRDVAKKQKSWTTIGETLGMTWNVCQCNWKSLRIRNTKIKKLLALGEDVSEEDKQLVDDMSFVPPTRNSKQGESLIQRENHVTNELLLDLIESELRVLAPNQQRLLRSRIYQILSELNKAD